MPKQVESIVKRLLKEGHGKNSAYALANYITDKQKSRKNKKK